MPIRKIVAELRSWRGNAKPLLEELVWDVTGDLYRQEIDVFVEVTFKRGPYRGTRSTDTRKFRVVGRRNDAAGEYHCYITNLSDERFSSDQVAALYRARWEVELLFRDLKLRHELDCIRTSKAATVKVIVLISDLTLVVSWVLLGVFRDDAEKRDEDPTFPLERGNRRSNRSRTGGVPSEVRRPARLRRPDRTRPVRTTTVTEMPGVDRHHQLGDVVIYRVDQKIGSPGTTATRRGLRCSPVPPFEQRSEVFLEFASAFG